MFAVAQSGLSVVTVKTVPTLHPLAFAAAPSGSKVAATFEDGTVRIFDASAGATVKVLGKHPQTAYCVAWSGDGKLVASGDESGRVWIFDVASGKRIKEFRDHQRGIAAVSFNRSHTMLASTGKDDKIKVYSLAKMKPVQTYTGGMVDYAKAFFLPKNDAIAAATLGEGARLMLPGGGLRVFKGHEGYGALDADVNQAQNRMLTCGKDGKVIFWTLAGETLVKLNGGSDWVQAVRFAPSGRFAASSCGVDRTVTLWNLSTREAAGKLTDASGVGSPLGWTADGRFLLSSDVNDGLRISSVNPPQPGGKLAPEPKSKKKSGRRRHA